MLCADHGPCVSGAHNSIVTARAGKDLVSSLVSGELFDFYMQNFYPLIA
jgi:ATP citrate (pro-S)-lyase